jgi:DNA polymerase/3'-5' exonuclease PolX
VSAYTGPLYYPGIVPIKVLTWLARAGVDTTEEVHKHIRAGTLRTLPGIGPKREAKIVYAYTYHDR